MKKSENLILRIDPDLKRVIDSQAEELEKTTSEMVREILSVIFLIDYENSKFSKYILERLQENKRVLNRIINNPLIEDGDQQKIFAKKNIDICSELEEVIKDNISK